MNLGVIIYSKDPEVVYNALRLALFALRKQDNVKVFLLASGVEYQNLDSSDFNIIQLADEIVNLKGVFLGCGTCLTLRGQEGSDLCSYSTLEDLYNMINACDKTISF